MLRHRIRDLARQISTRSPGETVTLKVWRDGKEQDVSVKLGELASNEPNEQQTGQADRGEQQDSTETLGMRLARAADVGIEGEGLAVVEIDPSGPAAESGIRVGDVILQASGLDVRSASDLDQGIDTASQEGRKNVLLKLKTGENTRFVALPTDKDRS